MKRLMLFWVVIVAIQTPVLSQSEQLPHLEYKGKGLVFFLAKNLKYPAQLATCEKSTVVTAIRFKLDSKGKISFVEAVGSIDDSTKNYLKAVMMQTNGMWKPRFINGKAVASKLIIQPIVFNLTDCNRYVKYLPHDETVESIQQIFNVPEGGEDCTLYSPLIVVGQKYGSEKSQ